MPVRLARLVEERSTCRVEKIWLLSCSPSPRPSPQGEGESYSAARIIKHAVFAGTALINEKVLTAVPSPGGEMFSVLESCFS